MKSVNGTVSVCLGAPTMGAPQACHPRTMSLSLVIGPLKPNSRTMTRKLGQGSWNPLNNISRKADMLKCPNICRQNIVIPHRRAYILCHREWRGTPKARQRPAVSVSIVHRRHGTASHLTATCTEVHERPPILIGSCFVSARVSTR